ncbi:hypothetical protein [Paenibacillus cucumis (ex Kampfer et al. 2016)]|uniref:Uncharacterized protein n=1 Tax=Paenibacillus cucumis (ex Kampfer et al. 2016) TaxID=1776858 RepID=A0ABS7KSC7_9BACL|nr:hypothetical protein [Paenibacillus cucumis (ex Kampfer et al. 2016)]MBY0207075.1 hypothetical protein [Paenibacillus cucumis (ex Kampfer et al. 2016)]
MRTPSSHDFPGGFAQSAWSAWIEIFTDAYAPEDDEDNLTSIRMLNERIGRFIVFHGQCIKERRHGNRKGWYPGNAYQNHAGNQPGIGATLAL